MGNLIHCCEQMQQHIGEGEVAIVYVSRFREYGIRILDGGHAFQEIYYCPWCGQKLPASLRDEWFNKLEELKLDHDDAELPNEFLSERWYLNSG